MFVFTVTKIGVSRTIGDLWSHVGTAHDMWLLLMRTPPNAANGMGRVLHPIHIVLTFVMRIAIGFISKRRACWFGHTYLGVLFTLQRKR